ncbi:AcrR family transcriptional regulator [Deinococcus budaensis]|uniref:AcrR family transcriptional regulator n=1 Tax=Deinococcus budaensis TaxID=1665626 RepID=A0A7W8LQL8_9DEIO|nr:TetR/AcrR family transcriptional regulator [Deinococcus budaensis]MBB5234740.1 AcrR family transcriptional regulator [Deinococcus budaensis]
MPSKREQIVAVALRLYREGGVAGTTLKDVAAAAGLPVGNLYYYFRTRDDLVRAALQACEGELSDLLARLSPLPPRAWFGAYFDWLLADPAGAARFGCPFGTLAGELRALGDPAAAQAAQTVALYLGAVRERTVALGRPLSDADDLFLAVQGAYTVARALNDPGFFRQGVERLRAAAPQLRSQGDLAP